jgi:alpha-galactosidase
VASILYVDSAKSRAVVFNYLVNARYGAGSLLPIRLKGLDPARKYRVSEIDLYPGTSSTLDTGKIYSGDFLMKVGINPDVRANRASVVLEIKNQGL